MTNSRPAGGGRRRYLLHEVADELRALALGQAADRLARRDPALREDLVDLHVAVLRHRQQHVGHLRGEDVVRRVDSSRTAMFAPPVLELPLQLAPAPS